MRFLKQSTSTTLLVGPMVDATDGVTAETALTLTQSDFLLWKEGGGALAQKNDATSATHRTNGYYTVPIDATDTNTLGVLIITCAESGAAPVRQDYTVLPANVFDSLRGTDFLQVDIQAVNDVSAAADTLAASISGQVRGTSDNTAFTGTTTEFEADDITEATADHYNGRAIVFLSGALLGQATRISDYALSGGRGHFTVVGLTEAVPDNTQFVIV